MSHYYTAKTNYTIKKGHARMLFDNKTDDATASINHLDFDKLLASESTKMNIGDVIEIYNEEDVFVALIIKLTSGEIKLLN
jgi:hypothetical protein